jgi:hypothetical protein
MSCGGRWGLNRTKGGCGVKRNMAAAIAVARTLTDAGARRRSGGHGPVGGFWPEIG